MGTSTDRIVLLGRQHQAAIEMHRRILEGSVFLFEREHELQNSLLEAVAEMLFIIDQYAEAKGQLLADATPELAGYISGMNGMRDSIAADVIVDLHVLDLSTYFKSFLMLARSILDKAVPLYSYQFGGTARQFSDKGSKLLKSIRQNPKMTNRVAVIALIEEHKRLWIDSLIDFRNEYAHYSTLLAFRHFRISGERIRREPVTGIVDFEAPSIVVDGQAVEALTYMRAVQEHLTVFLNGFLRSLEFTVIRRPKRYLNCQECQYKFAKKDKDGCVVLNGTLEIREKKPELDYGVIICPACKGTTDTDLKYWRDLGFYMRRESTSKS